MVIIREDDEVGRTYWRVYLRVRENAQNGSFGEPLRQLPWDFTARTSGDPRYYEEGGKLMDAIPTGYYIDFTQLAADYGWYPVPAARTWRVNTTGILYWQFIKMDNLPWEQAMRQLYPEQEVAAFLSGSSISDNNAPRIEESPIAPSATPRRTPTPQSPDAQ
jgi:TolB protein